MTGIFRIQLLILIIFIFTGCFRNPHGDAYTEFSLLMDNQFTASGSTLAFETCGWPVSKKMKLKKLELSFFPDSGFKDGRGYATISAEGDGFTCGGKLFFIYGYSYTGGHGYSGGTDIMLNIIERESAVEEKISNPSSPVIIETGKIIEGELSETGTRLPDNTPADYYVIDLKGDRPGIKLATSECKAINIKGYIYQDKMFISGFNESGVKLKSGKAVILISAGGKTGRYSFKVEELTEKEKSNLR